MQNTINRQKFLERTLQIARSQGYLVERNRNDCMQIDFGHKKLHEGHLNRLYPDILAAIADGSQLIENVAPGRPCAHKPMKTIIRELVAGSTSAGTVG